MPELIDISTPDRLGEPARSPTPPPSVAVNPAEFNRLADEWERQTRNWSSPNAIARHPVVDRIVAMGHGVVPLILERMRHRPWFWFEPLTRLTGVTENPVTADMRGDMQRMTDAWVQWGVERGRI